MLQVSGGAVRLAPDVEDLDAVGLPESLHGTMQTKIDRLPAACIAALKAACAKGVSTLLIMYEEDYSIPTKYAAPTVALAPDKITLLEIKERGHAAPAEGLEPTIEGLMAWLKKTK